MTELEAVETIRKIAALWGRQFSRADGNVWCRALQQWPYNVVDLFVESNAGVLERPPTLGDIKAHVGRHKRLQPREPIPFEQPADPEAVRRTIAEIKSKIATPGAWRHDETRAAQ